MSWEIGHDGSTSYFLEPATVPKSQRGERVSYSIHVIGGRQPGYLDLYTPTTGGIKSARLEPSVSYQTHLTHSREKHVLQILERRTPRDMRTSQESQRRATRERERHEHRLKQECHRPRTFLSRELADIEPAGRLR
jgi:hypothetical protein